MITINEARRLLKRAMLTNLVTEKPDLAITPLLSGKHGIGKSRLVKSLAADLGGVCLTIEGGTLKEGEITGLPYQTKDADGEIRFRFLPYYAVERIQREERRLYEAGGLPSAGNPDLLAGDENRWARNDLTPAEKLAALRSGAVRPLILFIDEINRTENSVYKELMNILLTRSVNGYRFPWWVFFAGAMNPGTRNSVYATNEMDPAQLDRFLLLKVREDAGEWLRYGEQTGLDADILRFIRENPKCLSSEERGLEDDEKPSPSPRGWDMLDSLLRAEPLLRAFFTEEENTARSVEKDMKTLAAAKLGSAAAEMFFASRFDRQQPLPPEELFTKADAIDRLKVLPAAKKLQSCDLLLDYLKDNLEVMMLNRRRFAEQRERLRQFANELDASTRLLFAQNISSAQSNDGTPMLSLLYDIFEDSLLETLDLSEETRKALGKALG